MTKLGISADSVKVTTDDVITGVIDENKIAKLANDWLIKRSLVNRGYRLEIKGDFSLSDYDMLLKQGANAEIITHRRRVFIPLDTAKEVLDKITASKPVVSLVSDSQARYALTDANPKGIPLLTAKGAVKKLGFGEAVATEADLPAHLRQQIAADGVSGQVKGIFDERTGQTYLIADKLENQQDAVKTGLHEFVGHKGIRAALGNRLNLVLEQVYRSLPDNKVRGLRQKYRQQLQGLSDKEQRRLLADEHLSHLAESDPKNNLVQASGECGSQLAA